MERISTVNSRFIVRDSDPAATEALRVYLREQYPKVKLSDPKPANEGGFVFFADYGFEWEASI